jgi:predicted acyl esterase
MARLPRLIALLAAAALAASLPVGSTASGADGSTTAAAAQKKKSKKRSKAKKCPGGRKRTKAGKCPARKRAKAKPKPLSLVPRDYTQIKGLSQPTFKDVVTEEIRLPMSDDVAIYLEVTRPTAEGRYGVIVESSGYHGTIYDRSGTRILPGPMEGDRQLGLKGFFPPRGYAVVMMDLRGTGKSQGCLDHIGPKDQSDIKAVIEWAASQPWSNGRVGITGHSYVGGTTTAAGAVAPKGLATFVPSAALGAMYHHQFQGGVPYWLQWAGPMEAYEQLALQADLPPQLSAVTQPTGNGPTGDNWPNDRPHETGCGMTQSAVVAGEDQLSGRYAPWHAERDFRAGATKVQVPAFVIHGVADEAARVIGGMDWFTARNNRAGDKLWLGQWDHGIGCCPNRRGVQWTYALHAWFDKHLLQRNVDTGPPVEIFLNDEPTDADAIEGRKEIYTAAGWPGSPKVTPLYPSADGKLSEAQASAGEQSFAGDPNGWVDGNDATGGADFATDPAPRDLLYVGVPDLELTISQTVERLHIIATLFDENAEGERRRLSQCAINPELREGLDRVTPVIPGAQMKIKPPCFPIAHHLRKGHKLLLRVTTSDPDKVPLFTIDPNVTVYTGPDASVLKLPLMESPKTYPDRFPLGRPTTSGAA